MLPKLEVPLDGQLIQLRHIALAQPPAQGAHVGLGLQTAAGQGASVREKIIRSQLAAGAHTNSL